jgi:thiamine-phosphate pyrophosphorylase
LIKGGATLIQIRDKDASSSELFEDALAAVTLARSSGVRILINDRVDIALMTGADGVHLGQDDVPARAARQILGEDAMIGVSTHTVKQARNVVDERIADYIAFGPIYKTSTKENPDAVVGLEELMAVKAIVGPIPLVAIGGIKKGDLALVLGSGADSAAMISEFYRPPVDITARYKELLTAAEDANIVVTR